MVPLTVRFGEEQFEDWRGIEPAEFYRRLRNGGAHPQTAAPSPGAYLRAFEALEQKMRLPIGTALVHTARQSATRQPASVFDATVRS